MRIGADPIELDSRAYAAYAVGWKRAFCGLSKRMGDKSVATLLETGAKEDRVVGVVVKLKAKEVAILDAFEKFPDWYDRKVLPLKCIGSDGVEFDVQGQAYIQVENKVFVMPAHEYLEACAKTTFSYVKR